MVREIRATEEETHRGSKRQELMHHLLQCYPIQDGCRLQTRWAILFSWNKETSCAFQANSLSQPWVFYKELQAWCSSKCQPRMLMEMQVSCAQVRKGLYVKNWLFSHTHPPLAPTSLIIKQTTQNLFPSTWSFWKIRGNLSQKGGK